MTRKTPEFTRFAIEILEKRHERDSFDCGNSQLNNYFQRQITQDRKRNIAIPYVVVDLDDDNIVGYYTLSTSSIDLGNLPSTIAKKLPNYPIVGVTLIGRLAVDQKYQRLGWGKILLMDALYKSWQASYKVASFAVVVEAIDEKAISFYQRFEFCSFPDTPCKLFRTMKNIAQTFTE